MPRKLVWCTTNQRYFFPDPEYWKYLCTCTQTYICIPSIRTSIIYCIHTKKVEIFPDQHFNIPQYQVENFQITFRCSLVFIFSTYSFLLCKVFQYLNNCQKLTAEMTSHSYYATLRYGSLLLNHPVF